MRRLIYTKTGIIMMAINIFLFILSLFLLRTWFYSESLFMRLPAVILSSYTLIRTITVEKFDRDYWIDIVCCWSIYVLIYYWGISDWILRIKSAKAMEVYWLKLFYSNFY